MEHIHLELRFNYSVPVLAQSDYLSVIATTLVHFGVGARGHLVEYGSRGTLCVRVSQGYSVCEGESGELCV